MSRCLWIFLILSEFVFKDWGDEYWQYWNFVLHVFVLIECWIFVLYRVCQNVVDRNISRNIIELCALYPFFTDNIVFFFIKSCYTVHVHVAAKQLYCDIWRSIQSLLSILCTQCCVTHAFWNWRGHTRSV